MIDSGISINQVITIVQLSSMNQPLVVQEGLRHSNARFTASMSRIMEEYSHPFKDDILVSTDTLTCDTPDRPKQWERVSKKDVKNRRKY
uniref:Uncharacterized protein n=1 Tax=Geospiza parvula TaxID=87175 RepID=A0A8C3NDR3_GEOPR